MPSKSELAYNALRERILSSGILAGEHLAEVDWADRLKVGRFAVREGLKRLHGEGLVTKTRNKYRVSSLSADEVRDITQLRAILEAGALRLRSRKLPAKILADIRRAANDYADLVKKGYYAGAHEADLRFHRCIVASAENQRLVKIYESSNLPLLQTTVGQHPVVVNDYTLVLKEHAAICDALENGDFELAALTLERHLKRGEREVLGE